MAMKISHIFIYPIKTLRGISVDQSIVTAHGLQHDRRYMLLRVHRDGQSKTSRLENIHVSHYPNATLFTTSIRTSDLDDGGTLHVSYASPEGEVSSSLDMPLHPDVSRLETVEVNMHQSATLAYRMDQKYNEWFSTHFGFETIIVHIGQNHRPVLGNISPSAANRSSLASQGWLSTLTTGISSLAGSSSGDDGIAFSDCAPLLVVTTVSVANVSARLPDGESMDVTKFRPNIVIDGSPRDFDEDFWGELRLANTKVILTQNCARCKSLNVDYATGRFGEGESGKVLKKLMKDRRVDPGTKYSPIFGRYGFVDRQSYGKTLAVGDEASVSKRNSERTHFGAPSTLQAMLFSELTMGAITRLAKSQQLESLQCVTSIDGG